MRKRTSGRHLHLSLLACLACPVPLHAQGILDVLFQSSGPFSQSQGTTGPGSWAEWELDLAGAEDSILTSLELCGDRESFHFTDFSGDGVPDLVYSGYRSIKNPVGDCFPDDASWTRFYENRSGTLALVFSEAGVLTRMSRHTQWEPVTHLVLSDSDPMGVEQWLTFYRLAAHEPLTFEAFDQIGGALDSSVTPEHLFDHPKAFAVRQDSYNLRARPEVLDCEEYAPFECWEYGSGARGVALGERVDSTGRVWWFVVMGRDSEATLRTGSEARRLAGWMSSRFLEVVEATPIGVRGPGA